MLLLRRWGGAARASARGGASSKTRSAVRSSSSMGAKAERICSWALTVCSMDQADCSVPRSPLTPATQPAGGREPKEELLPWAQGLSRGGREPGSVRPHRQGKGLLVSPPPKPLRARRTAHPVVPRAPRLSSCTSSQGGTGRSRTSSRPRRRARSSARTSTTASRWAKRWGEGR